MIVDGSNLQAAFDQLGHHGIDFGFEQDNGHGDPTKMAAVDGSSTGTGVP
jgi:hypothetical protein